MGGGTLMVLGEPIGITLEESFWVLECLGKLLQFNKHKVTMKSSAINRYGSRLQSELLEVF